MKTLYEDFTGCKAIWNGQCNTMLQKWTSFKLQIHYDYIETDNE